MSAAARIIIENRPGEVRACVLDDRDEPLAFRIERETRRSFVGAIVLGRVAAVRKDLGAAFIDLGSGTDGFLNIKDAPADAVGTPVSEGAGVLVQVTRDAAGEKGAQLSLGLDIVGSALVLTPGKPGLGLSGRVSDDAVRARLTALLRDRLGEGMGLVVRTAAKDMADDEILGEYAALSARWDALQTAATSQAVPAVIVAAPGLAERMIDRYAGPAMHEILLDDADTAARVQRHIADRALSLPAPVLAANSASAFQAAGIEDAFDAALTPVVPLSGGGSLIVSETPAMTTVDVNAGRGAAGNPERLALETNLQAADALARVLRVRGIGGLIAVDFLKMREDANRKRVLSALAAAFRGDPENPRVGDFSRFGIVDIVRRSSGPSLASALLEQAMRPGAETVALDALAQIKRSGGSAAVLKAAPAVCAQLDGPLAEIRKTLERRLGFVIRLEPVPGTGTETFEIESR